MLRVISSTFVMIVFLMMIFHPGRIQICLNPSNTTVETKHCCGCSSPEHIQLASEDHDHGLDNPHHHHDHLEIEPVLLLPDSNRIVADTAILSFVYVSTWNDFYTINLALPASELCSLLYPPLEDRTLERFALGFSLPVRC